MSLLILYSRGEVLLFFSLRTFLTALTTSLSALLSTPTVTTFYISELAAETVCGSPQTMEPRGPTLPAFQAQVCTSCSDNLGRRSVPIGTYVPVPGDTNDYNTDKVGARWVYFDCSLLR